MDARAVLIASLVVVAPGAGATVALFPPSTLPLPSRLAMVLVLGSCVGGSLAFLLAMAHLLTGATFFVLLAAATAALWFVGIRRAGLRAHARSIAAEVRADPWTLGTGLSIVVALAVFRLTFPAVLHFGFSTSWRYWADAVEIADAHRIPAQTLQYGMLLTPTVNKVFLNALSAGISFAIGREAVPALGAMLWLGSAGLAVALWAAARELGLRFTAALVPVLLLANKLFLNTELTADLATYKAEIFGRMVAFGAVVLGIRAIRDRRSWWEVVLAGVVFALAFDIHLVPVIVAASLLVWYALALVLSERSVPALRAVAVRTTAIGIMGGVLAAIVLVLPHGDLGFRGPGKSESYTQFGEGFDPTRYLNAGQAPGQGQPSAPGRWSLSPARSLRIYTGSATGLQGAQNGPSAHVVDVLRFVLPIGGAIAAIGMVLVMPKDVRPLGLAAWGLGLTLVTLTWFFSTRYRLFIPAWFGVRRLFDYSSIPLVLLGLALVEGLLVLLARVRTTPVAAGTVVLTVLVAAVLLPGARVPDDRVAADRSLIQGFDWIRANVPCDARILANEHTEGVFEALTGRVGVLEGVTPYLRPDILVPIVQLLLDARAFFHDPLAGESFLRDQGVGYVVLLRAGAVGYREPIGATDRAGIGAAPFLQLAHRDPAMEIYRVVPTTGAAAPSPTTFPDPSGSPGYACQRDPIPA